jgi:hypothetical protein
MKLFWVMFNYFGKNCNFWGVKNVIYSEGVKKRRIYTFEEDFVYSLFYNKFSYCWGYDYLFKYTK